MADAANQIANRIPTNLVVNGVRRTLDSCPGPHYWTHCVTILH